MGMKARVLSICRSSISSVPLLLLILLLICFSTAIKREGNGVNDHHDEELQQNERPWLVKSLAEPALPYSAVYLEKTRSVVEKANGYLFRPTQPDIDFRGSVEEEGKGATASGYVNVIGAGELVRGVGERVKEAASKSSEKSKSTLEDSAKLAGDAMQQMTGKIKSIIGNNQPAPE